MAELAKAAAKDGFQFAPYGMGRGAYSIGLLAGADGLGTWVTQGRDQTLWTSFVFTTGEIWGADAIAMNTDRSRIQFDPTLTAAAFANYRDLLRRLGLKGPWRWMAGMEGTLNRSLEIARQHSLYPPEGRASAYEITAEGDWLDVQEPSIPAGALHAALREACGLPAER